MRFQLSFWRLTDVHDQQPNTAPTATSEISQKMEVAPDRVSCYLLALPAELRLRIYEACLVPSRALLLTSSAMHRRYSKSGISPALLATCRQIHAEAQGILYKNTICVVTDAQTRYQPLIAESRCPQHALQKLRRIFMVLDYTIPGRAPFPASDFDVFTALTSLEQVRFAVVFQENDEAATEYLRMMLPNLLHPIRLRLPAQVQIHLGVELGSSEEEIVDDFLQRREESLRQEQRQQWEENARRQAQLYPSLPVWELQPVVLANMTSSEFEEMLSDGMNRLSAASPDLKPGLLSGSIPDVFALKRCSANADVRAVPLDSTIRQTGTAAKPDNVQTAGCKELDPGPEARPSRYRRSMLDVLRLFFFK